MVRILRLLVLGLQIFHIVLGVVVGGSIVFFNLNKQSLFTTSQLSRDFQEDHNNRDKSRDTL